MKICDKCFPDKISPIYDNILLGSEDMYIDLCKECMEDAREYLTSKRDPEKKRGRPKKDSASAE